MTEDEINFKRIIFASVLSIQYHPRNDVPFNRDPEVVLRCLHITEYATRAFNAYFQSDDIPF